MEKRVSFDDMALAAGSYTPGEEYCSSEEESFHEITTSEAETFCSSDEDDAERLNLIIEGAFGSSPAKVFSKTSRRYVEPAQRDSVLLLDKDFIDNDAELSEVEDSCSVILELTCSRETGCGTDSSDVDQSPPAKKKYYASSSESEESAGEEPGGRARLHRVARGRQKATRGRGSRKKTATKESSEGSAGEETWRGG